MPTTAESIRVPPGNGRRFRAGFSVPSVPWIGALSASLTRLLAKPPPRPEAFRRSLAFAAFHGSRLKRESTSGTLKTEGYASEYPLACTFLGIRPDEPLARTLGWLLLELHLEGVHLAEVGTLAANLRGFAGTKVEHALRLTIWDCDGLDHLLEQMGFLEARSTHPGVMTGHRTFDSSWRETLKSICQRMVAATASPIDDDASDIPGAARLDDPGASPPAPLGPVEPDEVAGTSHFSWIPDPASASISRASAERNIAWVATLRRRSNPELNRPPDSILPASLVQIERDRQLKAAEVALGSSEWDRAESCLVHLLALEAGLTDAESKNAAFASETRGVIVAIDIRNRCLRRPEIRPPSAFRPPEPSVDWVPTGGDALFPLSPETLHVALRVRLAQRLDAGGSLTAPLLLTKTLAAAHAPVRQAINDTRSCRPLTAGAYRLRLAAGLSEKLGTDAAQMAFGDSFGISTAPTYYAAFTAADISRALAEGAAEVGSSGLVHANCLLAGAHFLGSRARPAVAPFQKARSVLGFAPERKRGRPCVKTLLADWPRHRDSLAAQLLLCTGSRPTQSLAQVHLDDFIPAAALVVLRDKASDPAHLTRLACTGFRFVGALQDYIAALDKIANDVTDPDARKLAARILAGEAALFDLPGPDGRVEPLDVSALMARMPSPWRDKTNLHRHALCQALIRSGIDPELRFFQMGWLIAGSGTADESPASPMQLGAELAPFIDEWMKAIGWGGNAESSGLTLPTRRLRDWVAVAEAHQTANASKLRGLREGLREKAKAKLSEIQEDLAESISKSLPMLRVEKRKGQIRLSPDDGPPRKETVFVGQDALERILEPFTEPLAFHVARVEVARILSSAHRAGICNATLPRVSGLSAAAIPSPIVAGVGGAVTETCELRSGLLLEIERALGGPSAPDRLATLAVWLIASFTHHRRLADAVEIAKAAPRAIQGCRDDWLLRVPFAAGHVTISGSPALLLAHLLELEGGPAALKELDALDLQRFGAVVLGALSHSSGKLETTAEREAALRMESALLMAGEVECPGPARLVMRGEVRPATVTAERAASAGDGFSLPSEIDATVDVEQDEEESDPLPIGSTPNPSHRPMRGIRDLMAMFDPDFDGLIGGKPAALPKDRKRQIMPLLVERRQAMGDRATLSSLFLQYAMHRTSPDAPGGEIMLNTMNKIFHRVSPLLGAFSDEQDMSGIDSDKLTGALLAALESSQRLDLSVVFEELVRFLRFAEHRCDLAEPDWQMLRKHAGLPFAASDPAIVSDEEIDRAIQPLLDGLGERDAPMVDPRERRIREVQLVAFLIAESAGARPRSIHGLSLGDLHLEDAGDWIHLHSWGRFASIKTATSAGFVPLEGRCWHSQATWVRRWRAEVLATYPSVRADDIPLFQVPGEPLGTRYQIREIFGRTGELVRWATSQQSGRTYWLRKRRIQLRHARWRLNPRSRTRDVLRVLKLSGHASLTTAVCSYLADPLAFIDPLSLSTPLMSSSASRLRGLSVNVVEQRWKRIRAKIAESGAERESAKMGALLKGPRPAWPDDPHAEPPPYHPTILRFGWRAADAIVHSVSKGESTENVARTCAVSVLTAERVKKAATSLEIRTGFAIGPGPTDLHRPRCTGRARRMFDLAHAEDARLGTVAREWVDLAQRWPAHHGFALMRPKAISALRSLGKDLAMRVHEETPDRAPTILRLEDPDGGSEYGVWLAMRWALAVAWVALEAELDR